jgi:hypothetical protein
VIGDQRSISLSRSKQAYGLVVKSLNDHWSAGASGAVYTSTYNNIDLQIQASPALEYNIFPYSQSTRKQLRLLYLSGVKVNRYLEATIYGYTKETLFYEELDVTLEIIKPWGSVTTMITGSNYFHDFSKNYLQLYTSLSLNLIKGLSASINGDVSMVHNRLSLPNRGATPEEILLERRQLATQYSYWTYLSLEYAFGSIYNNVVNPRFGD